jgi:hypothetical protein
MARGDDILNLIIALTDMIGTIAKNTKKILAIIRKKGKGLKKKSLTTEITIIQ